MKRITVGSLSEHKDNLFNLVQELKSQLSDCQHIDLRVEANEGQGAFAENGMMKGSAKDYNLSYGVRVIAGREMLAPGYFGQTLGVADVPKLLKIAKKGILRAWREAKASAEHKSQRKTSWGALGNSLWSTKLAEVEICQDVIGPVYKINPLDVSLEELNKLTQEVSRASSKFDSRVKLNEAILSISMNRELFVSSEGANIDWTHAFAAGLFVVIVVGSLGVNQTHYDSVGHHRGFEVLSEGVDDGPLKFKSFMDFATDLTSEAVLLSEAKACPSPEGEQVVVTDPHYNALKVHEIIGHPVELDRGLKMETAYAGRTWFLKNLQENMLGKQVASPLVSAYSDPSLPGFGYYPYDHEGTPAKKVVHIDRGRFVGFMNSRQTAAIFGGEPNAHYKAIDASLVPLIRMSTTVFAKGDQDLEEILQEVRHGYYLVGHRIPSISESRENFRITSRKVCEIKQGEITEVFRDGGMMANTKDYLMAVDAVGDDFRVFPIFNCAKGQPMQVKRLGNGGPTMRSRARVIGG